MLLVVLKPLMRLWFYTPYLSIKIIPLLIIITLFLNFAQEKSDFTPTFTNMIPHDRELENLKEDTALIFH